jgi:hypothetical protein
MKQIFTLLSAVVFTALTSNAQFTENFENYAALPSNCWKLTATNQITGSSVISDAASIGTDPTVTSEIKTPYLDISGICHVSFDYQLNNKLNNNSTRTVEVGTTDKNGNFVAVSSFTLNKTTAANKVFSFSEDLALPIGVRRFTIRISTLSGDGNSFLVIDNLSVSSAALHYGATPCNTAPVATNANFFSGGYGPFSGSISTKASDSNAGETLAFALDTLYTVNGSLVLHADGTFTFTPAGNFAGGTVTFKYKVTDDGYDPLTSNIATVTITYPVLIPLPVSITSFVANASSGKAQLFWTVAQNENGSQIVVEKSTDGKTFTAAAVVLTTTKAGSQDYQFTDVNFAGMAYYRLKTVTNNEGVAYSRTIFLQEGSAAKASNLTILQNPVLATIKFDYTAAVSGTSAVTIYNLAGVRIFTTQVMMNKGRNTMAMDLDSRVTPGSYIMEVVSGADRSVAKLVKR